MVIGQQIKKVTIELHDGIEYVMSPNDIEHIEVTLHREFEDVIVPGEYITSRMHNRKYARMTLILLSYDMAATEWSVEQKQIGDGGEVRRLQGET